MQGGADKNQAGGPLEASAKNIGCQHVDREHMREAVLRHESLGFAAAYGGIVGDRIEAPDSIDLLGNAQDLPDAGEVTHCHAIRTVGLELEVCCTLFVAGMQHNLV